MDHTLYISLYINCIWHLHLVLFAANADLVVSATERVANASDKALMYRNIRARHVLFLLFCI